MRRTARNLVTVLAAGAVMLVGAAGTASAHEERESQFPSGNGTTPTYRPFSEATPRLVVCKPDSRQRIARIADPRLRAFNQRLLGECRFEHLQAAVDSVNKQGTNIYVLPGVYREEPSHNPPCTRDYDGGVVDYDLIVSCGEVINLVTIAGDDPADEDIVCDNALCDLQIEGTGARMEDVVFRGGFTADGDWVKHNGIKADRADGFYLRNVTAELFRENAIYVHETDGYALDRINARHNDLYGILTFTSDHGLIQDCDTSYNGDSGVYPGSAADVNADNPNTERLTRWSVEIRRCNTHHNALGFSGTAGNSVWFHDNLVHHNQAGYVTDSFVGGHPGMPQDHAFLERNRIFANNNNYVKEFVQSGTCDRKPADRGYGKGTVCPAFPVPVGTGVLIAGGNRNLVTENHIYDNWRAGAMLFWVPGAIRGDDTAQAQFDTSNGNHFTRNWLGRHPSGALQPNGTDWSWDEQGVGNCWEGNVPFTGAVTDDVVLPLPDCKSGGSRSPVGNAVKSATFAPCATYNREDMQDPPLCDWFDSPAEPEGRTATAGDEEHVGYDDEAATALAGGGGLAVLQRGSTAVSGLAGLVLVASVLVVRRRARPGA